MDRGISRGRNRESKTANGSERKEARILPDYWQKLDMWLERDINNTNNINQQQLRVQQHSTRSKDLLADGTARLDW